MPVSKIKNAVLCASATFFFQFLQLYSNAEAQVLNNALVNDDSVVINEIFPNPVGSDPGFEWIEIFNNGESTVDIGGWTIDVATTSWSTKYSLPASTFIAPGEFLVVGDEFVVRADLLLLPGTTLGMGNAASSGDAVRLTDDIGAVADTVVYGTNNEDGFIDDTGNVASSLAPVGAAGKSIARITNGLDTNLSAVDFSVNEPTPGLTNTDTIFTHGFEQAQPGINVPADNEILRNSDDASPAAGFQVSVTFTTDDEATSWILTVQGGCNSTHNDCDPPINHAVGLVTNPGGSEPEKLITLNLDGPTSYHRIGLVTFDAPGNQNFTDIRITVIITI